MMRVLAAAVLPGSPSAADAASVGAHAYVYGLVPDLSGGTTLEEAAADRYSDDTALDGPDRTAAAKIDVAGTVYMAASAVDIRTGGHSSSVGVADAIPPGNFASAEATSFETFTVRGDGTVTFRPGLSAGWNLPTFARVEDAGGLFLTGRMHVAELGDADGEDLFHRVLRGPEDSGSVGSVTEELVHVLDVTDGGSYMFNTWVVSE